MEASSLDVDFHLVFHLRQAVQSKQATQTQCRWGMQSHGFESVLCGCGFDCGRSVDRVTKAQCLECGV